MPDFSEYPPNLPPQQVLNRQQAPPDIAIGHLTADVRLESRQGTSIQSNTPLTAKKRKDFAPESATETFLSDHTFRRNFRTIARGSGDERSSQSVDHSNGRGIPKRGTRQKKGNPAVAEGEGSYIGPWTKYRLREDRLPSLDMDPETFEQNDDPIESGTVVKAPGVTVARREELEQLGNETTTLHALHVLDYQGRTYMHVPKELGVDLRKDVGRITNYIPKKLVCVWKDHSAPITALRFFPGSGHLLLSSSSDSTIRIRDVFHERQLLRTFSGHSNLVSDISFNCFGTQFISASYDKSMKLWDTETGACISKFSTGKIPYVVKFNHDSEHIHEFLAGMADKKIVQFDTRKPNELIQEYDHHLSAINTIVFVDQNRRFMTTSDDRSLRAWDYNIPVPIKYIAEPDMYPLTSATLHPSGKHVAYQSADNQILVYNASDKFRQNRKKSYRGHNNAGFKIDLDCSPDGQFLASGDSSGIVCFWDWRTCKLIHKLKTSSQAVTCVRWHPQETSKVVTAGYDGAIRYWD